MNTAKGKTVFTATPGLTAEQIGKWRLPRKYRRPEGMYGDAGKFAIAANIGTQMRIFEYFKTQAEADAVVKALQADRNPVLTVMNLYIMTLDNWVPVPFQTTTDTDVTQSDSALNPFQAHLDSVIAEAATIKRRMADDDEERRAVRKGKNTANGKALAAPGVKGDAKAAPAGGVYDSFVQKIHKLAARYAHSTFRSRKVRAALSNPNMTADGMREAMDNALKDVIECASGTLMQDFKTETALCSQQHAEAFAAGAGSSEQPPKNGRELQALVDTWRLATLENKGVGAF